MDESQTSIHHKLVKGQYAKHVSNGASVMMENLLTTLLKDVLRSTTPKADGPSDKRVITFDDIVINPIINSIDREMLDRWVYHTSEGYIDIKFVKD